ncbi:hypothetical protein E2C01_018403 [Portunus trituberculatus]|uniref:Uncharacterized protein n=1 Tax=Portunus trituberculatus TaxID=210409 RepID=A0A5B7DWR4_PORTR|nr:hypothetical protein [Portunus trituberculatus]
MELQQGITHIDALLFRCFPDRAKSSPGITQEDVTRSHSVALSVAPRGNPPTRKPLPRVRKPNLHSDRGQDSKPCAWRPLGPQSTHGSTAPRCVLNISLHDE